MYSPISDSSKGHNQQGHSLTCHVLPRFQGVVALRDVAYERGRVSRCGSLFVDMKAEVASSIIILVIENLVS